MNEENKLGKNIYDYVAAKAYADAVAAYVAKGERNERN